MANFTSPTSFDHPLPILTVASSSSSSAAAAAAGAVDDTFEEACSICLDPFTTQDPATVTCCKHEYHLQCILDWSQRSKECPICWQLLVLKDPASQELLAAVESERRLRSRNLTPAGSTTLRRFREDFDVEEDASYSDDSDFDERIMQHLAVATSRAHYARRRERQRSSGFGPSQVLIFTSPSNLPGVQHTHSSSPEECQSLSYESSDGDSPTSGIPSAVNGQYPSSVVPLVGNMVSNTTVNKDDPYKPRVLRREPAPDSPRKSGASEVFTFSESVKSKWSVASARCKESLSKSTRGLKEKLHARNNSVKELSKGVQREMSAGIAGVARMIERLDLSSKQTGVSVPVSGCTGGTSNFSFKGKGVQENVIVRTLNKTNGEIAHNLSSDAPSYNSGTIPGQVEVSRAQ